MLIMMYVGLYFVTEHNAQSRITGICTLFWVGIASYLLISQFLLSREQTSYSLFTITVLSTVGFIVGKTIAVLWEPDRSQNTWTGDRKF
jgi:hypothetical protein